MNDTAYTRLRKAAMNMTGCNTLDELKSMQSTFQSMQRMHNDRVLNLADDERSNIDATLPLIDALIADWDAVDAFDEFEALAYVRQEVSRKVISDEDLLNAIYAARGWSRDDTGAWIAPRYDA